MDSKKRALSDVGDGQREKRRKMDRSAMQQCALILKRLMSHTAGWVFNQPVDPIKLKIPDYFHIISEPMDLGTIKRKLDNNHYSSVDQFTAHVRLTFSNAMRYNPPSNNVHHMARELYDLFDSQWNELEAKWNGRCNVQHSRNISGNGKQTDNSGKEGLENHTICEKSDPNRLIPAVEKQKLKKQLLQLLRGKVPSHLQGFLKKSGFDLQRLERIEKYLDALSDEVLWELRKIIRSSRVKSAAKVNPVKELNYIVKESRVKITFKGSANVIPHSPSLTSKCALCRSMKCTCNNKQCDRSYASTDISSKGSRDHLEVQMRNCGTKLHSNLSLGKSELESHGWASLVDVPLSSQKALRAALLKSRFAETILKAKEKIFGDHGDKTDPVKFKQEKERLERQQQEEKARIEAQIRASKEARKRSEVEKKLQREREREAARLAVQQMVKTVEIINDHKIIEELELLSNYSLSNQFSSGSCNSSPEVGSRERSPISSVLEQLGLFIKYDGDDCMENED